MDASNYEAACEIREAIRDLTNAVRTLTEIIQSSQTRIAKDATAIRVSSCEAQ